VSYILDALTKAAQQRDRQVPAVQRLLTRAPSARSVWGRAPTWLIAALTANAVLLTLVLVWWSWPTGITELPAPGVAELSSTGVARPPAPGVAAPSSTSVAAPPAAAASRPAPVPVAPASPPPRPASAPAPLKAPLAPAPGGPAASTLPKSTPAPVVSAPPADGASAEVERPGRREPPKADAARRPVAGGSSPATAPKRAPEVSAPAEPQTAPPSPRQAAVIHSAPAAAPPVALVPPIARGVLKLEALIYSDVPLQRMVFVNGRRYVEGDVIDGRFRIEEIQDEGVQLSDQGRRFMLRPER
jgi:Type II secretion system protein B